MSLPRPKAYRLPTGEILHYAPFYSPEAKGIAPTIALPGSKMHQALQPYSEPLPDKMREQAERLRALALAPDDAEAPSADDLECQRGR